MKTFKTLLETLSLVPSNESPLMIMPYTTAYYLQRYLSSLGSHIETQQAFLYQINDYLYRLGYCLNEEDIINALPKVMQENAVETSIKFSIYSYTSHQPCTNCCLLVCYLAINTNSYLVHANLEIAEN